MIREPKKATLARYGLTLEEWRTMLEAQGGVCYVCEREPPSGRLCIDHFHVKGWKKMPPERRKLFVRGLLCWTDNHYLVGRGANVPKARRVLQYLEAFEARIGAALVVKRAA
jgi:hypothetical protein